MFHIKWERQSIARCIFVNSQDVYLKVYLLIHKKKNKKSKCIQDKTIKTNWNTELDHEKCEYADKMVKT